MAKAAATADQEVGTWSLGWGESKDEFANRLLSGGRVRLASKSEMCDKLLQGCAHVAAVGD
jgi:hypothetical protein